MEIGILIDRAGVRDSKNPSGPVMTVPVGAFRALTAHINK
ncbi:DUF397 domain-containing protein [Actinokineospora sp.]